MAAPLIEAADCTVSGNNTAQATWAVSHPNASTGDLLIWNIAWDDSATCSDVTEPAGPNGETLSEINATPAASASTEVRGKCWYTIATGSWTAGTRTFTPAATESWTATCIRVPAGEFDATTPIGAAAPRSSAGTAETSVLSPAISAGATDGGGTLVWFGFADADPLSATNPTGWTILQRQDLGAVAHGIATRDTATTDSESIAGGDAWAIDGDSWASVGYIVRGTLDTWSATGTPSLPILTASGSGSVTGLPGEGGDPAPLPHLGLLLGASGATFSGSGTPNLPLLTATGAGTKERKGAGTPSLPILTASGSGTKARKGDGTPSLPALTASGSGKRGLGSTGTPSLPLLTASGAGTKARKGDGSPSLPLLTASGAGKRGLGGSGTPPLPLITASGSGSASSEITGDGAPSLPILTASGSGTKTRKGDGAPSLPILTASGSGTKARKGDGTPSLPLPTASGAGTKARKGEGTPSLPLLTADGVGTLPATGGGGDPAPLPHLGLLLGAAASGEGSGASSLPLLTAAGEGAVVARPVSSIQTISRRNRPGRGPHSVGKYYRPPLRGSFTPVDETLHSGSGSPTLPLITAEGSGKRALKATGTPSLPLITATGSGTKARKGAGTPSLPLLTASGAGKKERAGTGSATLPLLTATGSGVVTAEGTFTGEGTPSLPLLTATGSGKRSLKAAGTPSLPLLTASGAGKRALLGSGSAALPLVTSSGAGTGPQVEEPPRDPMLGGGPTRGERKKFKDWLKGLRTRTGSGKATLPVITASGEGLVVRKISEPFKTSADVRKPLLRLPAKKKPVEVPVDIDALIAKELRYAEELEAQKRKRRRKQDEEILLLM